MTHHDDLECGGIGGRGDVTLVIIGDDAISGRAVEARHAGLALAQR